MAFDEETPRERERTYRPPEDSDSEIGQHVHSARRMNTPWRAARRGRGRKKGAIFRDLVSEADDHEFLREKRDKLIYITDQLNYKGFDWLVFFVAASGFLTGSYQIFVTNTVTPSIQFVYFQDDSSGAKTFDLWSKITLLMGTMFGQILFGVLGDLFGRANLYGIELLIVIFSTFGFAFSSYGVSPAPSSFLSSSLSIESLFYCWRFIMGVGIGAEYPLSAVLTAEWASVDYRAQMLAAVFSMQSIGQLCASGAGWSAISIMNSAYGIQSGLDNGQLSLRDAQSLIDRIWRGVVGFGAIPAAVAIIFRFYITDPGRYTLEVQEDVNQAIEDTDRRFEGNSWPWKKCTPREMIQLENRHRWHREARRVHDSQETDSSRESYRKPTGARLWDYLWKEGNWVLLLGTCGCWFLLDVAFYGLGVNSPQTLSLVWANHRAPENVPSVPPWNPDPTQPHNTIYDVLRDNARRLILSSALGSIVGSILILVFINRIRRKTFFATSFVMIFFMLLATALSLMFAFGTKCWIITLVLYVLCQVLFNFGANTLTFVVSAEIFPTRYRCSFHGLSAASGKFGSVIIQAILHFALVSGGTSGDAFNANATRLGYMIIGFSFFMLMAAPIAWICIPELQFKRDRRGTALLNKTLEELAPGISAAERDGQVLGLRWFKKAWPGRRSSETRRRTQDTFNSTSPLHFRKQAERRYQ